jgi:SAM-dependent methyltransferase
MRGLTVGRLRSATRIGTIADMETTRATSFGAWADEYDEWRPTYPDAAVDWLVPPGGARVVEVGAGTGKLTDRLIERGLALDVVEPDGRMLSVINQRHPRLRTHQTGAATLPFGDATVDAVLVADAWHWFPKTEAAAEVARVLRPQGWLGCVWNVPVLQHAWEWQALMLDPALPCSFLPSSTPWTVSGSRLVSPISGHFAGPGHSRRSSGEDSCRRSLMSGYCPRTSTEQPSTRPSNWSHRRARRRGRRPRRSRTMRCACAGTQRDDTESAAGWRA